MGISSTKSVNPKWLAVNSKALFNEKCKKPGDGEAWRNRIQSFKALRLCVDLHRKPLSVIRFVLDWTRDWRTVGGGVESEVPCGLWAKGV